MEKKENETFQYTYSAKEQKEIQNIRKKYLAPQEDKLEYLRKLDAGVTKKATVSALIPGVIGALILGLGMSLVMTDLSGKFGLDPGMALIIGIMVGVIGMVLMGCAYPLYNRVLRKERARIAPEILRITEELSKN